MTALQASLLCKPSLPHTPSTTRLSLCTSNLRRCSSLSTPRSVSTFNSTSQNPRFRRHRMITPCALHQNTANLSSESGFSESGSILGSKEFQKGEFGGEIDGKRSEIEAEAAGFGELVDSETKSEDLVESEGKSESLVGEEGGKSGIPLVVFLMGVWATARKGFERFLLSDWFSWWPFWRQEKRLERLIAEADANPKDVVKQNALLAELNKHSPESVIKRFEQRDHCCRQ
ncbi:hypothetical protein L1049_021081 [Liquidambar formosana]|uniref:Uncharacterized protein n=1 Tax=Liquidambar formosana TaxID=63359 RepID=A0AAP0X6N1_LIQFO